MPTTETAAALLLEIKVWLTRLDTKMENMADDMKGFSTVPDRLTRTETRLDEAEKQANLFRAQAEREAATLKWLLGIFATCLIALGTLAAAHIPWK